MLRWMKEQKRTYTFTRAQLDEHDRQVRMDTLNRKKEEMRAYTREFLEKEFAERQKLLSGDSDEEVTLNVFSLLISVSCVVLVKDFGWKPIWKHSTGRQKLARFVKGVQREVNAILNDEMIDLRQYAKDSYDVTGVMFTAEDDVDE